MKVLKFIGQDNITDQLTKEQLIKIAQRVTVNRRQAKKSMESWIRLIDKSEELNKPVEGTKDFPWRGASNYKSTAFDELSHRFGEQASNEILRQKELVKTEIIGKITPEKRKQSDRISTFMSYEINHKMPGYREEQDKLFFCLPNMGQAFKILEFCPIERKITTDIVYYPDFVVHQKSSSSHDLINFTRTLKLSRNDVYTYQTNETWRDVELSFQKDEHPEDGELEMFYEQWTTLDLDEDGYAEPYRVTWHEGDEKVVRILPLFDEEGIFVEQGENVVALNKIQGTVKAQPDGELETLVEDQEGIIEEGSDGIAAKTPKVIIKITPFDNIVPYSFLPSLKDEVLGVGFYSLLVGIVDQINSISNQLIDAGTVANLRGGWLAQGVRLKKGEKLFYPGQYRQTSLSVDQLAGGIRDIQFAEPSQVLYTLLQDLKAAVKDVAGSVELEDLMGTNIAASTVLMMLEETQRASNSIMARLADSMSREFAIMARLIRDYFRQEDYEMFLETIPPSQADMLEQQPSPSEPQQPGQPPAPQEPPTFQLADDFLMESLDVLPTANPALSTKARRIQQAQMEMDNAQFLIDQAGVDPRTLAEDWFASIGITDVERYLPIPTPEQQKKQAEESKRDEEMTWREREANVRLIETNADMAEGEADRAHTDAQVDLRKVVAEVGNINAKTIKALEEADEIHSTHLTDIYSSSMAPLIQLIEQGAREQELRIQERKQQLEERQLTQGAPNAGQLPGPTGGQGGGQAPPQGMEGMAQPPSDQMGQGLPGI